MERLEIFDDVTWGQLVKTWSLGESRLPNGYRPANYPRTLKELDEQCGHATRVKEDIDQATGLPKAGLPRAANTILHIPESTTGLAVLQYSEEVLSLRLPPKALVERAEKAMETRPFEYPLPKFYRKAFDNVDPTSFATKEQDMEFHACRIGDYSVRNCG